MSQWLRSGRRRDLCVLLAGGGPQRGQELKAALETHYDQRLEPASFYGSLSALVDAGLVEQRTEGITDVYALTEPGEAALDSHYDWMRSHLEE